MHIEEILRETLVPPSRFPIAAARPDEAMLLRQTELLAHVLNSVADPIFVKDEDHRWTLLNDACCRFMGHPREDLIGKSDYDFFPPEQAAVFWKMDDEAFARGTEIVNEEEFTNAEGQLRVISTKKSVFRDPSTGRRILVGVIRDITEIKTAERRLNEALEKLRGLSNSDELTGLANRRHFLALATHQERVAQRTGLAVLLLFADMDNLKVINDQLGHGMGDRAIVEMADTMRQAFRDSDVIARVGGDEFVVLMSGVGPEAGRAAVDRLRDTLRIRNERRTSPFDLMMSIGIAYSDPARPVSITELLDQADSAMYQQKRARKRSSG